MGFLDTASDFLGYMIAGENSEAARRMRKAKYDADAALRAKHRSEEQKRMMRLGDVAHKVARRQYSLERQSKAETGRRIQYVDSGCRVEVKNGYSRDRDEYTTDILVFDRSQPDGGHVHLELNEEGEVIVDHWRTRK